MSIAWLQQLPAVHLQRPLWLWALCALPLLWLLWHRHRREAWRDAVDPHLLAHLIEPGRGRSGWRLAGISLAWVLSVLALAGPGWRQEAQPRQESRTPLVVALDLSASMLAPDLPPTRLAQARAKIETLLREREGGEVGLVAWAEDAYPVAPLTADAGNVALFLEALAPDLMPVDGHRVERALTHAATLLRQAGFEHGDILLLTGEAEAEAQAIAGAIATQGYRISVIGLGTPAGAMYRDGAGATRPARLDEAALRALAAAGGGGYARLAADDSDLRALGVLVPRAEQESLRGDGQRVWLDQGYWLLPPLLVLVALLVFRRGAGVLAALPLAVLLAMPGPARAAGAEDEGGWWRRADQQAQQRIERGVEAYRQGDYATAGEAFAGASARGADADYNLGNALARQGRYDEAIAAYDRALARSPGMEDAIANRRVVEAARRQQQEGQGRSGKRQGGEPQPAQDGEPEQGDDPSQDSQGQQRPPDDPGQPQDRGDAGKPDEGPEPQAEDGQARQRQEQADREQRERMQEALQQGGEEPQEQVPAEAQEDAQTREERQAREAWLRRIPDDPGGLLRARFRLEYERRLREGR
ncbi:VWA domain-containing protein [Pseudoxanthomonas sp. J35]|uniref:VWA domain-containing protein n=1 Tax=Pseudoxanthomonas sp. J35 TaxID=935852 RepID=UPI00049024CF|nr:VWA domain-containing protein [Pseudoxanthomonas sp. J35]